MVALTQRPRSTSPRNYGERYWLETAHIHKEWLAVLAGDAQCRLGSRATARVLPLQPEDARMAARAVRARLGVPAWGIHVRRRLPRPAPRRSKTAPILQERERFWPRLSQPIGCISGETTRRGTAVGRRRDSLLSSASVIAPILVLHARIGLALVAVQRNDAEQAREQYAALESQRDTAFYIAVIAADRLLGLLAATLGERDRALAHFEAALAFCNRAGYRPEYAWTAFDHAEALLERVSPGDRDKAMTLQDEALVIARELGMLPLLERVLSRREILEA